ncbi:MAG: sulfurtransferase, partial [Candidatus Limnocylindrales bacterium]
MSATISVVELAERISRPELRVVDLRWTLGQPDQGRQAYAEGHIPGAIFLDLETDLSDPTGLGQPGRHPLPDPPSFAARLAAAGIGDAHEVVAYDDAAGTVAARLWWMLDDLGHERVAVLDGGYPAWLAAGLPVTAEVPALEPAALHLRERWSRVIDRPTLRARLGSVVLLDARAPERYRGEVEPIDPVAGHIPTARSAPALASVDADGRLLGRERLRARYVELGAATPRSGPSADPSGVPEVVTSCGSGVNACHHALAMRLAGLP